MTHNPKYCFLGLLRAHIGRHKPQNIFPRLPCFSVHSITLSPMQKSEIFGDIFFTVRYIINNYQLMQYFSANESFRITSKHEVKTSAVNASAWQQFAAKFVRTNPIFIFE